MPIQLRPYAASDEDALVEVWRRTWQMMRPSIDFSARVPWLRNHLHEMMAAQTAITVCEKDDSIIGFVTVDTESGYLDQMAVVPEAHGSGAADALMRHAKSLSPGGLNLYVNQDNERAIRFYEKHGFVRASAEFNPNSMLPIYLMMWAPV